MMKVVLIMCLLIGLSHAYSSFIIQMVNKFNATQQQMMTRIQQLESIGEKKKASEASETALEKEFEDSLAMLERRAIALTKYLVKEKRADINLKDGAKVTINDMKSKVKKSDLLINELKRDVTNSLKDFDAKINKVNRTAHLTVNVKGVVFIGSIGSTCSAETEDCNHPDSVCRDGKCQCDLGLSFDNELNQCRETCKQYGCTFQSSMRRIIREYNDKTIENVTQLAECKDFCIQENGFTCKSFDYFPRWNTCYLSQSTKKNVPEDSWEYNSAGAHFQRDCLGIAELSLCNDNKP